MKQFSFITAYLLFFLFSYGCIWSQNVALSKTGKKITLSKATIGLNNVDNTADSNKPISTATLNALNAKQDAINKTTDINLDSNFPVVKAVKDYIDGVYTSSNSNWWKTAGNDNTSTGFIGTTDNTDLVFKTNNIERMRITTNGNIGIGTSMPQANAHIVGKVKIVDGNQSEGKILTGTNNSTANGYANWVSIFDIMKLKNYGYYAFDSNTVVAPIVSGTGKVWMDRNLGALQRPQSPTDYLAFGQLFQWGRANDGHADISWVYDTNTGLVTGTIINGTSTTLTDNPIPTGSQMIVSPGEDWRINPDSSLWNGLNAANNPCPRGYRVPTYSEFMAEINYYSITNNTNAFSNNPLRFMAPGSFIGGTLSVDYTFSSYWTSSYNNSANRTSMYLGTTVSYYDDDPKHGFAIRCIKD